MDGAKTTITKTFPLGSKHGPSVGEEFRWSERWLLTFSQIPVVPTPGTAQTLLSVSLASSNTNHALAKVGDTITLTIVAKELIENMVVSIAWHIVNETIGIDRKHFTASYVMTSDDVTGAVTFSIDWTDLGGNIAVQEVAITDASSVTFDKIVLASNIDLTAVNQKSTISQTPTIATEGVKVIVGNSNIGGAVIATTGSYTTTISVTGTASATTWQYSGNITVQDATGNQKVITISLLVQEAI